MDMKSEELMWVHHIGIHTVEYSLSVHLATAVHKKAFDPKSILT